ncbi:uncharacterized protein LOC110880608 [Helianthus annuus]|uniref:uncharacterized protein LOC110880608 n=1 Tax=Helianthus annuus TaxID=4232 RepID=UPI000B8FA1D6|nr:uncharacterized protein LOC110880608 [Helianthus annuus]
MGFPPKWCSWISGILSSARVSVLVNGSPNFEFSCNKEALSCIFDKACEMGALSGIALPNDGPTLSHPLYADDAMILGEWSKGNVLNVVRILRCFYACFGLRINIGKSCLYGVGVSNAEVIEMAELMGCRFDSLPFKYLGLTV